ncbi:MAG: DHH family phosphoesterase [bacterium]
MRPAGTSATIARTLRDSSNTLIVCHVAPDGDCLGAGLALAAALQRLGGAVTVGSADGVSANLAFLPGADAVVRRLPVGASYPVAVTMECSDLARTGSLAAAVAAAGVIIAIDHHAGHRPYAHLTDWDPTAAAVGEQVAAVIDALGVAIDRPIALGLLTALVTDTGVFRYGNTTARTLRLAADLVDRGATIGEIVRAVYEEQPPSALRLLGHALAGLTLHEGGAVATSVVTPQILSAAGAAPEEVSGIAAMLRTIRGVRFALTFEERGATVRISIRARDGVRADRVAEALGGGGHAAAAGAEPPGPLEDVVRRAMDEVRRELSRSGDRAEPERERR